MRHFCSGARTQVCQCIALSLAFWLEVFTLKFVVPELRVFWAAEGALDSAARRGGEASVRFGFAQTCDAFVVVH
jgi:hypothetical protein